MAWYRRPVPSRRQLPAADEVLMLVGRVTALRPLAVALPDHPQVRPLPRLIHPRRFIEHRIHPLLHAAVPSVLRRMAVPAKAGKVLLESPPETGPDPPAHL